jgi:formiminotetrahydrofolate cyclodeaminase
MSCGVPVALATDVNRAGMAELLRVGAPAVRMVVKRGKVVSSGPSRNACAFPAGFVSSHRGMTDNTTSLLTMAVADALDAFASSEPVPGGGSAAALAGALGVSLLLMVAGLSRTRTAVPEGGADLASASARLRTIREQLMELIERDADAYRAVLAARRRPKTTEAERRERLDAIQAAMQIAIEAPLDVMRACQQALRGAVIVARTGLASAASDVAVGVELLLAAVRGAGWSVDANLPALADASYASRVAAERRELEEESLVNAERARQARQSDEA